MALDLTTHREHEVDGAQNTIMQFLSPPIIPRCAPQTLRIDPEMASPLRKLNRVRRASDMDMWAISAEATATPAEVTAVTLFLELSTSDGGDELDMMEMLRECLREEEAWDVKEHMGNEGRFAASTSLRVLLLRTRQWISNCNLPGAFGEGGSGGERT